MVFLKKIFGFPGENFRQPVEAHKGQDRFTGVYANAIANDRVLMPDAFSRLLPGESLFLVVPEGNRALPHAGEQPRMESAETDIRRRR